MGEEEGVVEPIHRNITYIYFLSIFTNDHHSTSITLELFLSNNTCFPGSSAQHSEASREWEQSTKTGEKSYIEIHKHYPNNHSNSPNIN